MNPTKQQIAIFARADDDRSLVIEARAGTGKTTTAVEFAKRLPPEKTVIFVAFNKGIQTELSERLLGSTADCRTLHSVGCATLGPLRPFTIDAKGEKIRDHLRNAINATTDPAIKKGLNASWGGIKRLVGLGKNLLVTDLGGLAQIARIHDLLDIDAEITVIDLAACVAKAIETSVAETGRIDFDDMVSMPAFHKLKPKRYDVVIVDEAQDVNPAQQYLIEGMVRNVRGRTSRMIAIGDDRQAIYQFRGAGDGVLGALADQFDADRLPLSVTFRCGSRIVEQVQRIVPDYEAAPGNPTGIVREVNGYDKIDPQPGDFVLSRLNAPLVKLATQWLAERKPVVIAGRDIAGGLISLIERSKAVTIEDLAEWIPKQSARYQAKYADQEQVLDARLDTLECLTALIDDRDGSAVVGDVIADLRRMFQDRPSSELIVLSSVHKAKGLERDRVWLLRGTFRVDQGNTAEDNIYYVAVTRARHELVEVYA